MCEIKKITLIIHIISICSNIAIVAIIFNVRKKIFLQTNLIDIYYNYKGLLSKFDYKEKEDGCSFL